MDLCVLPYQTPGITKLFLVCSLCWYAHYFDMLIIWYGYYFDMLIICYANHFDMLIILIRWLVWYGTFMLR